MAKIKYLIFLFLLIGSLSFAKTSFAASFYVVVSNQAPAVGDTVTATIYVNSNSVSINSAEGVILAPTDQFDIQSVSTVGSIFNLWVEQPTFSNGVITFSGGLPNPGYTGSSGKIFSIIFKAKAAGTSSLTFQSAAIRANDGLGTNVGTTQPNQIATSFTVGPSQPVLVIADNMPEAPIVRSDQFPNQEKWYSATQGTFYWPVPPTVTAASLLLDKSPNSLPSVLYEPAIASKNISDLGDGIFYLHVRLKNSAGWGPSSHVKIKVDHTAPDILLATPSIDDSGHVSLSLRGSDKTSRIASYAITVDDETPITVKDINADGSASYEFTSVPAGTHAVLVRVFDEAGNSKEQTISINFPNSDAPIITTYPTSIEKGERFKISGTTSYPKSSLVIWIQQGNADAKSYTTTTQADGSFTFESDFINSTGLVTVWAETVTKAVHGTPSEKIYIAAGEPFFVKIGSKITEILGVAIPILILILVLIIIGYIGYFKIVKLKRKIRRELDETESEMQNALETLHEDLKKHARLLLRTSKSRPLTTEESNLFEKMSRSIKKTEAFLTKKVRDIERKNLR